MVRNTELEPPDGRIRIPSWRPAKNAHAEGALHGYATTSLIRSLSDDALLVE